MKKILKTIKYKIKGRFFDLIFGKEGQKMKRSVVSSLLDELQGLVKRFNPAAPWKIKPYVAQYIEQCLSSGQPVNILVQWCVTKMLEERRRRQGGKLEILPDERKFFQEDIPKIFSLFSKWGLKVNFIITFNLSEFERSRPNSEVMEEYKKLIIDLAAKDLDILFMDGDEFFGREEIKPNQEVLLNIERFVKPGSLNFEFERGKRLMQLYGYNLSDEEILQSTKEKISSMAEEGRILCQEIFPEGFLIVPIENPERYDFFDLLIPDFKDRLVPAVRRYPWRLGELY